MKMHDNNVRNVLYFMLFTIGTCAAVEEYVVDQQYYDSLGFADTKPSFSKKVYTATVDGISLELEGPIILDNCGSVDTYFDIDLKRTSYFPVKNEHELVVGSNCTLMFPKMFIKTKSLSDQAFAGFITIKALHQQYVLDVTSVVLLPRANTNNFKLIFEIDGDQYIILNYFYFKLTFVLILTITISILIVEITEIYEKYKKNKYKKIKTSVYTFDI